MENWKRRLIEKAEAALVGLPDLSKPLTTEQLRNALALQLGKFVTPTPPRIIRDGEKVFNPGLDVTAGELRSIGTIIQERIPDCAWIPLKSIDLKCSSQDGDTLHLEVVFKENFHWVSAKVELKEIP